MRKVLGIKCAKDALDWVVLEGDDRETAVVKDSKRVAAPPGKRGAQLVWFRKEILELLQRHAVDEVAVRVAEPGGKGNSLPRAEVEGVVQEAATFAGANCRRVVAVSMRSAFSVKNGSELEQALTALQSITSTPKSRRDPVATALTAFKE